MSDANVAYVKPRKISVISDVNDNGEKDITNRLSGGCLCGLVKFELDEDFKVFYQCHCKQCQSLTGSAFASNLFTHPQNISWLTGVDSIILYEHPDQEYSKNFCKCCGSAVPFLNKQKTALIVPAGSLKSKIGKIVPANIFMSEKACWSDFGLEGKSYEYFPE
ncbi:MAG: hypothetical protein ACJAYV_002367 [Oleispira sp.]|jgi:hypothetical protein